MVSLWYGCMKALYVKIKVVTAVSRRVTTGLALSSLLPRCRSSRPGHCGCPLLPIIAEMIILIDSVTIVYCTYPMTMLYQCMCRCGIMRVVGGCSEVG